MNEDFRHLEINHDGVNNRVDSLKEEQNKFEQIINALENAWDSPSYQNLLQKCSNLKVNYQKLIEKTNRIHTIINEIHKHNQYLNEKEELEKDNEEMEDHLKHCGSHRHDSRHRRYRRKISSNKTKIKELKRKMDQVITNLRSICS